ncbi:ribonuclease Z [Psychroflexus sp. MES1-P1E]|uniref:ribonuclease Z n=1 Tax=Psychroflexus sp. MES1-P1E TaxID=2058320 RepID=UPI000C7A9D8A|nr:ribonuclease Z [Psychroflexus sp. MES1-P1E]PKG42957.1 ribonuclease Z [Psychroflexus sp. MES1-P1E]
MKTEEKDNYTIFRDEKEDVNDFAEFLTQIQDRFKDKNIVTDITKYGELTLEELLMFLKLSTTHRKGKKSFVIVNDTINIDLVPEEIHVVPTLQEAEDLIGLEELERDLGF